MPAKRTSRGRYRKKAASTIGRLLFSMPAKACLCIIDPQKRDRIYGDRY